MTVQNLQDVIKTDLTKQTNSNNQYTSKDVSDSFMKIFDSVNKTVNSNKSSNEYYSANNDYQKKYTNQDDEYSYNYEEAFSGSQEFKTFEERNSRAFSQGGNESNSSSSKEFVAPQKDNASGYEVKQEYKASASEVKDTDQAKQATASKTEAESQNVQSEKSTADDSKVAESSDRNASVAVKSKAAKEEIKDMKDDAKLEIKDIKEEAKAEVKEEAKAVDNKEGKEELKAEIKDMKDDAKLEIKDLKEEAKAEIKEVAESKPEAKEAKNELKAEVKDIKEEAKLEIKDLKQVEPKDDVRIENIKVAEVEPQKVAADVGIRQDQRAFQQDTKSSSSPQVVGGEGQKLSVEKTARFEKVLNAKQPDQTQRAVVNQVKGAMAQLRAGKSEVSISLRPGSLGKVNINLMSQKGEVTAQITAENEQVKEMLTKGLDGLRQNLSEQGVNVNKIVVNVQEPATKQESENDFANQSSEEGSSSEMSNQSEEGHSSGEGETAQYENESFEMEEDGEETVNNQNLVGNVDYKV